MPDAAPTHVGNVEQAVEAVEVDESAEIGDIIDGAIADVARGHFGQELDPFVVALLFDQFAAGQDDVLAFLVDLDDLKFVSVADKTGKVLGRDNVNLRRGQESFHADVDQQTAFDRGLDFAHDGAAFVANRQDLVPVPLKFGFFLGQDDHPVLVLELLDEHIDFIADFDRFDVVELIGEGMTPSLL